MTNAFSFPQSSQRSSDFFAEQSFTESVVPEPNHSLEIINVEEQDPQAVSSKQDALTIPHSPVQSLQEEFEWVYDETNEAELNPWSSTGRMQAGGECLDVAPVPRTSIIPFLPQPEPDLEGWTKIDLPDRHIESEVVPIPTSEIDSSLGEDSPAYELRIKGGIPPPDAMNTDATELPSKKAGLKIPYRNATHVYKVVLHCLGCMTNEPVREVLQKLIEFLTPERRKLWPYQKGGRQNKSPGPPWWSTNPWSFEWPPGPFRTRAEVTMRMVAYVLLMPIFNPTMTEKMLIDFPKRKDINTRFCFWSEAMKAAINIPSLRCRNNYHRTGPERQSCTSNNHRDNTTVAEMEGRKSVWQTLLNVASDMEKIGKGCMAPDSWAMFPVLPDAIRNNTYGSATSKRGHTDLECGPQCHHDPPCSTVSRSKGKRRKQGSLKPQKPRSKAAVVSTRRGKAESPTSKKNDSLTRSLKESACPRSKGKGRAASPQAQSQAEDRICGAYQRHMTVHHTPDDDFEEVSTQIDPSEDYQVNFVSTQSDQRRPLFDNVQSASTSFSTQTDFGDAYYFPVETCAASSRLGYDPIPADPRVPQASYSRDVPMYDSWENETDNANSLRESRNLDTKPAHNTEMVPSYSQAAFQNLQANFFSAPQIRGEGPSGNIAPQIHTSMLPSPRSSNCDLAPNMQPLARNECAFDRSASLNVKPGTMWAVQRPNTAPMWVERHEAAYYQPFCICNRTWEQNPPALAEMRQSKSTG